MYGYIKLHRRLMENPIWTSEPFTRGQAWVDLILKANAQPGYVRKRGTRINLERGDVGYSIKELSRQWGWSESKTRRYLKELEDDGMVTVKKTNVSCTITLLNYDYWQSNDWQTRRDDDSAEGAQSNAQTARKRYPNNKDNKIIRNKEKGGSSTQKERSDTHTTFDINALATKYSTVDVETSYEKFTLNQLRNNKKSVNEAADFEMWLLNDKQNGWNVRPPIKKETVTLHCPQCGDTKEVMIKGAWKTICSKCDVQMVHKSDLPHV
jgi:predicted acetyltransferase